MPPLHHRLERWIHSRSGRLLAPLLVLLAYGVTLYFPSLIRGFLGTADLTPEASRALIASSRAFMEEGQYEEALHLTERLHRSEPNNPTYLYRLAQLNRELACYEDEAALLEQYMNVAPIPGDVCLDLLRAYERQGNIGAMTEAAQRCLAFDPRDVDTLYYLGRAYELGGMHEDARAQYHRGLELSPGYLDMRLGLARIDLREGLDDVAEATAREVLEHNPGYLDALLLLGAVLQQAGRLGEARATLERGARLAPDYRAFHLGLGEVSEALGDQQAARRYLERARAVEVPQCVRQDRR